MGVLVLDRGEGSGVALTRASARRETARYSHFIEVRDWSYSVQKFKANPFCK